MISTSTYKMTVSILIIFMMVIITKNLLTDVNLETLKAENISSANSTEESKSVIWFVERHDEALKLSEQCRKNIGLANTNNCINAEYALKLTGR